MSDAVLAQMRENIVTRDDIITFKEGLKIVSQEVFRFNLELEGLVSRVEPRVISFVKMVENEPDFPSTATEKSEFLATVSDELNKFEIIKLTLAFNPERTYLSSLQDYLGRAVGNFVVLEVFVQEEIVGGCIIEFRGKYADLSVAREIDGLKKDSGFLKNLLNA